MVTYNNLFYFGIQTHGMSLIKIIYLLCLHGTTAVGMLTVTYKQFI